LTVEDHTSTPKRKSLKKYHATEPGCGVSLRRLTMCIVMLASMLSFHGCDNFHDQRAYEQVAATMSMEKAKRFFDSYPRSRYRDRLVEEIRGWCKREGTKECYRLLIQTLPQDHRVYQEVVASYEKGFGTKELR